MKDKAYIEYLEALAISLLNEREARNQGSFTVTADIPSTDAETCHRTDYPFNSKFTFSPLAAKDFIRQQREERNGDHETIAPHKIGRLQSVTYTKGDEKITIGWPSLHKQLFSNQICLVTPDGDILPVIRKGQL